MIDFWLYACIVIGIAVALFLFLDLLSAALSILVIALALAALAGHETVRGALAENWSDLALIGGDVARIALEFGKHWTIQAVDWASAVWRSLADTVSG